MNFNSLSYGIFLAAVCVLFWSLRRSANRGKFVLLLASYVFYMSWDWRYAGLLLGSTAIDFILGKQLDCQQVPWRRKLLLVGSLAMNLGILATFKYFNFFIDSSQSLFAIFDLEIVFPHSQFLLPVGISFFTFQTMSYSIDIYRRRIEHERSFLNFSIFVAFFPQLVAGPIVRAVDFLPQLHRSSRLTGDDCHRALLLIVQGLFKKIVLADLLATLLVDDVFSRPGEFGAADQWLALYGYAFQIYNDFSGYSDIAIGSAALLGFKLPENFNRPYVAKDIREFWSRWHISLSTWLRDYLYIPLGGSRRGSWRTKFNLMLTMLLGGLWHGASMNFLLWGFYHGVLLILAHRFGNGEKASQTRTPDWIRMLVCFHLVLGGWLLFRVQTLSDLQVFASGMTSGWTMNSQASGMYLLILLLAAAIHLSPHRFLDSWRERIAKSPAPALGLVYAFALIVFTAATTSTPSFIYFQF